MPGLLLINFISFQINVLWDTLWLLVNFSKGGCYFSNNTVLQVIVNMFTADIVMSSESIQSTYSVTHI